MFEWLVGSEWYITVANIFSFIGSMGLLLCLFEKQKKVTFIAVILFSFILACVFGWFPDVLSYVSG